MVPKQDTFWSTDAGNYETYTENNSINKFLFERITFTQFHIKSMLVCTKASNPNHRRNNLQNVISGFCCEVDENIILGNYAAYSGNSLSMVGTTLQSQQSSSLDFLTLKDETDRLPCNTGKELQLCAAQYPRGAQI